MLLWILYTVSLLLTLYAYYSKLVLTVPVTGVEGKCDIRKKHDLAPLDSPTIFEHIFFCEHLYDPDKGTIKQVVYIYSFSL